MAIPDDKSRLMVTLPDKLKSNFELICNIDKRTASKQLEYILEYYTNNIEKRLSNEDYDKYYNEVYLPNQLIDEIYYFCTRINGKYKNRTISAEYFYEVFKDENITDFIVDSVISQFKKFTRDASKTFLKFMDYYTIYKNKN